MSTFNRALISSAFGLLGGIAIFAAVLGNGQNLSWTSWGYVFLTPLTLSFMFARWPEKVNWEMTSFCGALLLAEALFLTGIYPFILALMVMSFPVATGALAGVLAKVFSIEIPGLRTPGS